jgi:two-component system OmpR family response regulator
MGKENVYLTKKEYTLLEFLLRHKGETVSRGMIMEHVWDLDGDPFSNTIETHIFNLRKKIEQKKNGRLIFNVPGRGYKITTAA